MIQFYEDGRLELYNLRNDIGETKNLAADMPERAGRLRDMLVHGLKDVAAQMPANNPAYDPSAVKIRR